MLTSHTYQGHSLNHVLDVATDGAHCGQLLPVTPPFVHTELEHTSKEYVKYNNIVYFSYSNRSTAKLVVNAQRAPTHFSGIPTHLLLFLAKEAELQVNVVELPAESTSGALDNDSPPLQSNLNCKFIEQRSV